MANRMLLRASYFSISACECECFSYTHIPILGPCYARIIIGNHHKKKSQNRSKTRNSTHPTGKLHKHSTVKGITRKKVYIQIIHTRGLVDEKTIFYSENRKEKKIAKRLEILHAILSFILYHNGCLHTVYIDMSE